MASNVRSFFISHFSLSIPCVAYFLFRLFVFIYRFLCVFRYAILDSYSLCVFDNIFFFGCFFIFLLSCVAVALVVFFSTFSFSLVSSAICIGKTHYVRFCYHRLTRSFCTSCGKGNLYVIFANIAIAKQSFSQILFRYISAECLSVYSIFFSESAIPTNPFIQF